MIPSYFHTGSGTKSAGDWHPIDNLQWLRWPMFLRVKVEKKFWHYILRDQDWINVLYVTPISEDPPLGLIDRQSRLLLGSTDTWGNVDRKASAAEGIPDTLRVCSWRLDGSRWIWPRGWDSNQKCWISWVEIILTSLRVVGTREPGACVG